jgi:hypothetical protein
MKVSDETSDSYEQNMQWRQAATLTVTINSAVVEDDSINEVEVKVKGAHLNADLKLWAHPQMQLNNSPL